MFKRLSIGFLALLAVYVLATGDLTLVGLKYRLMAYAAVLAEGLAGSDAVTASPAQSVAATPAGTVEPGPAPPDRVRVHLASLSSEDLARREWLRLREAFPAVLAGLDLEVEAVDLGAKGVFYRVLARVDRGPDGARRICASLRASGQYCKIVRPPRGGDAT